MPNVRPVEVVSVKRTRTQRESKRLSTPSLRLRSTLLGGLAIVASMLILLPLSKAEFSREDISVEDLKARVSTSTIGDRPHLCVQIAQKELDEANKAYANSEMEKAEAALTDVVAYTELARDYAIQSHKYQKQSEIAVREMTRKLTSLLHTLGHDDQGAVKDAVKRLERVSDDLLASMFKKGAK